MKYEEVNEAKRIQESVHRQGKASLAEGFNKKMYSNPIWKKVDKSKWLTSNGMNLFQTQRIDHSAIADEKLKWKSFNQKSSS
jgi:hypothetical protein